MHTPLKIPHRLHFSGAGILRVRRDRHPAAVARAAANCERRGRARVYDFGRLLIGGAAARHGSLRAAERRYHRQIARLAQVQPTCTPVRACGVKPLLQEINA
jgi:hypothetical protein